MNSSCIIYFVSSTFFSAFIFLEYELHSVYSFLLLHSWFNPKSSKTPITFTLHSFLIAASTGAERSLNILFTSPDSKSKIENGFQLRICLSTLLQFSSFTESIPTRPAPHIRRAAIAKLLSQPRSTLPSLRLPRQLLILLLLLMKITSRSEIDLKRGNVTGHEIVSR